jgi:hypothetical protein
MTPRYSANEAGNSPSITSGTKGVQLTRRHLCLSGGLAPGPPRRSRGHVTFCGWRPPPVAARHRDLWTVAFGGAGMAFARGRPAYWAARSVSLRPARAVLVVDDAYEVVSTTRNRA